MDVIMDSSVSPLFTLLFLRVQTSEVADDRYNLHLPHR